MIHTLVTAVVGAFGTLAAPSPHAEYSEVRASGIEVVLDVSETHFGAENLGRHDFLMIFGDANQGVMSHTLLHPGTSISYDFKAGLLDGMFLEILSLQEGSWIATGALPLGEFVKRQPESIWVQSAKQHLNAWIERADGFDLWADSGPLVPQTGHVPASKPESKTNKSMHVPVVDPSDEPEEEKPPVLEPKPLPPV